MIKMLQISGAYFKKTLWGIITLQLTLLTTVSFAQTDTANIRIQLDSAQALLQQNPDAASAIAAKMKREAEQQAHPFLIARSQYIQAKSKRLRGDLVGADSILTYEMKHYLNEDVLRANILHELGIVLKQQSLFNEGLKMYNQAFAIREKLGDKQGSAKLLNSIGRIHFARQQYDLALDYYYKSFQIYQQFPAGKAMGISLQNIGKIYEKKGVPDSAAVYYNKALTLYEKDNDEVLVAYAYVALAGIEMDVPTAFSLLNKSIEIRERLNLKADQEESYRILARLYLRENDPNNAIILSEKALQLSYETGHLNARRDVLEQLYLSYLKLNDFQNAYRYQSEYYLYQDSIKSKENDQALLKFQAQFKNIEQQKEILLLKKNQEIQAVQLAKKDIEIEAEKKQFRNILIGSIVLFFLLIIVAIQIIRLRKANSTLRSQKRKIEQGAKEKETLVREIHHRVKNNLQVITSLLRMEQRKLKDGEAKNVLEESKQRIAAITSVHENLYNQQDLTAINLQDYLTEIGNNLLWSFDRKDEIELTVTSTLLSVDADAAVNFGLLTAELITNSVKHAFPKNEENASIAINISLEEKSRLFNYCDNGVGLASAESNSQSFGMKLIEATAKKMNGKITNPPSENGYHLRIEFN
jgi:two-component sensor histidine kinase/tetratricopeptide (TPR) repeat protein